MKRGSHTWPERSARGADDVLGFTCHELRASLTGDATADLDGLPPRSHHGMELPSAALHASTMHRSDTIAIAKLAQASRGSTLAAPFNLKDSRDSSRRSHLSLPGHKHHHHSHHHGHHRHSSRSSKHGGDDKETKSAVLPTTRPSYPDGARSGNNASGSTNGGSGIGNDARDLVSPSVVAEYDASVRRVSSRVVRPEDVVKERARRKRREEYVVCSAQTLSQFLSDC